MSGYKHTPGDWIIGPTRDGEFGGIIGPNGEQIARAFVQTVSAGRTMTAGEEGANELLIVSSPALLDACREADTALDIIVDRMSHLTSGEQGLINHAIDTIAAAIARATGADE